MGNITQNVVECRDRQPDISASAIARTLGISRERVRQILKRAGCETDIKRHRHITIHCRVCGRSIGNSKSGLCHDCKYDAVPTFEVKCSMCGALKSLRDTGDNHVHKANNRHWFCDRHCMGKWLAENHGFQKGHLERVGNPKPHRKYDYDLFVGYLKQGKSYKEISELMGISTTYAANLKSELKKAGVID
jgi:DNA-binding CsgD family transcriptional regulator